MSDESATVSIPSYITEKLDAVTKGVLAEIGRDTANNHAFLRALLRVEVLKASAELTGAMRADIPPIGESQRVLTTGVAVAKMVELGGLLNSVEVEALEVDATTFSLQMGTSKPFSGTYLEFKEWAEEHYWKIQT